MSALAFLASEAFFNLIKVTLTGLDMLESAGANVAQLKALRDQRRGEGKELSADDVQGFFARAGTARDALDAELAATDDETVDVPGDAAVEAALDTDPPAAPE